MIFLDIDGVLNSTRYWQENGPLPMGSVGAIDPVAVSRLNRLISSTGDNVILISSWKTQGWQRVAGYLYERGFKGAVVGATPTLNNQPRSSEILDWLEMMRPFGYDCNRGVVIDDEEDARVEHPTWCHRIGFVWCNHIDGLTDEGVDQAIAYMKMNYPNRGGC